MYNCSLQIAIAHPHGLNETKVSKSNQYQRENKERCFSPVFAFDKEILEKF